MNFELVCLRRLAAFRLAAAFLFVACPMMGQVTGKAMLKKEDYARWHDISTPKISADGRYVSFEVRYPSGTDTLYVKDSFGNKKYSFAKGRSGRFCSSGKFTVLQAGDTLSIVQLESGQIEKIPGVTQYRVIDENDVLAILRTDKQQNTSAVNLILMSSGRIILKSEPVASWLFSPANDALAIVSQSDGLAKVNVIKLQPPFNLQEVSRSKGTFSRLQWQDDGKRVTFRETNEQGIQNIGLYDLKKNSTYSFTADSLPANWSISPIASVMLDDAVFFYAHSPRLKPDKSKVQVWNTHDNQLYPRREKTGQLPKERGIIRWEPQTGAWHNVLQKGFDLLELSSDGKHALQVTDTVDRSYSRREPVRDYYLNKTGKPGGTLLLKNFPAGENAVFSSPGGRYFTFFQDGHWWAADCSNGKRICLSQALPFTIINPEGQYIRQDAPFEKGFWTLGDQSFLIHDEFDIWEVFPNMKKPRRLTRGREQNLIFRLAAEGKSKSAFFGPEGTFVNLREPQLLKVVAPHHEKSGYYLLQPDRTVRKLYLKSLLVKSIQKAEMKDSWLILEEDYHIPPRLKVLSPAGDAQVIHQSNRQQQTFLWGKAEQIWYRNPSGERLPATLCYPANYDPAKSYPMVVSIYQRQSGSLHRYTAPEQGVGAGINITNLTTQGYFVLLPDLVFRTGHTGHSALQGTLAALDAALAHASIDPMKVGLVGHSFGGYLAAFIATQTSRFATIVMGSGNTNLVSQYLSISENMAGPIFWRTETDQLRMGKGLYDDFTGFLQNSPVYFAKNISCPLLTYSGTRDGQVDPRQGMELWLASLKLRQKHVLLHYPNEEHVIAVKENQRDLCEKIEQWFGYYLKGEPYPRWAEPEQNRS